MTSPIDNSGPSPDRLSSLRPVKGKQSKEIEVTTEGLLRVGGELLKVTLLDPKDPSKKIKLSPEQQVKLAGIVGKMLGEMELPEGQGKLAGSRVTHEGLKLKGSQQSQKFSPKAKKLYESISKIQNTATKVLGAKSAGGASSPLLPGVKLETSLPTSSSRDIKGGPQTGTLSVVLGSATEKADTIRRRTIGRAVNLKGISQIAEGACKIVRIVGRDLISIAGASPNGPEEPVVNQALKDVVYTAKFGHGKELREEVGLMHTVAKVLEKAGVPAKNLALRAEVAKGIMKGFFGGTKRVYAVITDVANGALEGFFNKADLRSEFNQDVCKQCIGDLLGGLSQLQKAGYVTGDLKPDNLLLYKKDEGGYLLKLSDFGKSKKVDGNGNITGKYSGNPRFAPPESTRGKGGSYGVKGDVYAAGLCMVRMLEELVLDSDRGAMVLNVAEQDIDSGGSPKSGRRGVERFILQHKAFSASDGSLRKNTRRNYTLNEEVRANREKALGAYVDELMTKLSEKKLFSQDEQKEALADLLKGMLKSNPKERLTIETCKSLYDELWKGVWL